MLRWTIAARNGKGGPLPPRGIGPIIRARFRNGHIIMRDIELLHSTPSLRADYYRKRTARGRPSSTIGGMKAALDQIERIVLRSLPMFKPQDGRALSFAGKFTEEAMNEDRLNMDIRKYLKVVGVTSQREIELAVRAALAKGTLDETSVLKPTMILRIPEIGLNHVIDGEIALV